MSKFEVEETKVIPCKFKGKEMFAIFEVDKDGNADEDAKPVVNMGIRKAQHLIIHLKELQAYVLENS